MTPTSPRLSTPSGTSRRTTQTARTISTAKDFSQANSRLGHRLARLSPAAVASNPSLRAAVLRLAARYRRQVPVADLFLAPPAQTLLGAQRGGKLMWITAIT